MRNDGPDEKQTEFHWTRWKTIAACSFFLTMLVMKGIELGYTAAVIAEGTGIVLGAMLALVVVTRFFGSR
jgi:hypothetical protein